MDEQSKPPRRPRIAGDIERTSFARRRTPVEGVPAVVERESSEAILVAKHIDVLNERFDRIEAAVTGYTSQVARQQETLDGLIVPSVKSLLAAADAAGRTSVRAEAKLERTEELLEGITETLKDVLTRMGRLEKTVDKLDDNHDSIEKQLGKAVERQNAMETRLGAVERRLDDAALTNAIADRTHRKWITWTRAGLVGIGGAVMWLVKELGLLGG